MSKPKGRKFFINPIELSILLGVAALFVYSTFQLIYSDAGQSLFGLKAKGGRSVASIPAGSSLLGALTLDCNSTEQPISANWPKVKLSLGFCEPGLQSIEVTNQSLPYSASVFKDNERRTASTDYVTLKHGENLIEVRRTFQDKAKSTQTFKLIRE